MKKETRSSVLLAILCGIMVTFGFLLFFSGIWFTRSFSADVGFDAVLFTLFSDLHGVNTNVVWEFILQALLPTLLCAGVTTGLIILPGIIWRNHLVRSHFRILHRALALLLSLAILVSLTWVSVLRVGLDKYIAARLDSTDLFDNEYIDPDTVDITFPEEKRNLIYIYLESYETTFMSEELGGARTVNLLPELTDLAQKNLNFSQSDGLGGAQTTTGSTWTIAAMISQTSGVPLCLPEGIWNNGLDRYSLVFPGLTTLTDILHENGYDQTLMVGSDASFGGRREYFAQHGLDHVYDLFTAREEGLLPSDYWNDFWGFEDYFLFQYAKEKLTELAKTEQPFAFTMLTVDTHHPQGYVCLACDEEHSEQFENVISCSSRQVAQFVSWIKSQSFYENTTIIITGDHYSMNAPYIENYVADDYTRRVYNCFINTPTQAENPKNRDFVTLDMFPTTLAAIGCEIEGNRLGLGTNLFSSEQTLTEKYGFDYLCTEINKVSPYYQNNFLYGKRD